MKQNWWKWTGFLLVLYGLIAGLSVPLGPGIKSVSADEIAQEVVTNLVVSTRNAHFKRFPQHLQLAIGNGSRLTKAQYLRVINDNTIEAGFVVPSDAYAQGSVLADLVISSVYDGLLIQKNALRIIPSVKGGGNTNPHAFQQFTKPFKVARETPLYFSFPYREILYETIRNTFYHIAMWFCMLLLFLISVIYSVLYLRKNDLKYDVIASEALYTGLFFGILGLATGSLWAKYTWGDWWPNDAKLNGTLISILLYFAYGVLRNSIEDTEKRARIAAVYNVFAFPMMFVLIMILPRLTDSLHPGNGGNPAFSSHDADNHLRMVSYPAWTGFMLMAVWILQLKVRLKSLNHE